MPATTTSMVRAIWQNYFYAMNNNNNKPEGEGAEGAEAAGGSNAAVDEEEAPTAQEVEDDPIEEDLQVRVSCVGCAGCVGCLYAFARNVGGGCASGCQQLPPCGGPAFMKAQNFLKPHAGSLLLLLDECCNTPPTSTTAHLHTG